MCRAGLNAGSVSDAQVRVDLHATVCMSGEGGAAELGHARMNTLADLLIDIHLAQLIAWLLSGFARKLQHAGVPGNDRAEALHGHGLLHQIGEALLRVLTRGYERLEVTGVA